MFEVEPGRVIPLIKPFRKSIHERARRSPTLVERVIDGELGRTLDPAGRTLFSDRDLASAVIVQKAPGMVAGTDVAERIFQAAGIGYRPEAAQGVWGETTPRTIGHVHGPARNLLVARRPAMNAIAHLSGIATLTARFVAAVDGTPVRIVATRKTALGLGTAEARAVALGGGLPSPACREEVVWVNRTHQDLAGGIVAALDRLGPLSPLSELHVECQTLADVERAMRYAPHRFVLDNMDVEGLRWCVRVIRAWSVPVEIEATGNVDLARVRSVAEAGVDFISVGEITHSARALDVSLRVLGPARSQA